MGVDWECSGKPRKSSGLYIIFAILNVCFWGIPPFQTHPNAPAQWWNCWTDAILLRRVFFNEGFGAQPRNPLIAKLPPQWFQNVRGNGEEGSIGRAEILSFKPTLTTSEPWKTCFKLNHPVSMVCFLGLESLLLFLLGDAFPDSEPIYKPKDCASQLEGCVCIYMYTQCMYVCMYVCIYIYMYTIIIYVYYIYAHTYIYIHNTHIDVYDLHITGAYPIDPYESTYK